MYTLINTHHDIEIKTKFSLDEIIMSSYYSGDVNITDAQSKMILYYKKIMKKLCPYSSSCRCLGMVKQVK